MMTRLSGIMLSLFVLTGSVYAGTIVYSYDEQHRLAGVNFDNEATITYAYDKANNLVEYNVLTEAQYLKPFMLWQSWQYEDAVQPMCNRNVVRMDGLNVRSGG